MFRVGLVVISVAWALSGATAAELCNCKGGPAKEYSGAHDSELSWSYSAQLVELGGKTSPTYCYAKSVKNNSGLAIHAINWPIAQFYRRVLPARAARGSCVEVLDDIAAAPQTGPLHFGVSSKHDTTVLPPKSGWQGMRLAHNASSGSGETERQPKLSSRIDVDIEDANGTLSLASVLIESAVSTASGGRSNLQYRVVNLGPAAVLMFVNLPMTDRTMNNVSFGRHSIMLAPRSDQQFNAVSIDPVAVEPVTVVLRDFTGRVVALERIGLYVAIGGSKTEKDDVIWTWTGDGERS